MEINTKAKLIATRKNTKLKAKNDIWTLIYESYKGGIEYITSKNLFQYRIEDNIRYNQRLARADYQNHTQQLIDMITGFIYSNPVKRFISEPFEYIENSIHKGKSLQSFMNMIASNCLKSTVGILIDSPRIDSKLSQAERKAKKLNPYAVYYSPFQICDYDFDDNGELEWIILDNSYIDKTDPYKPEELKTIKRLWTKTFYQDVEIIKNGDKDEYTLSEEIYHGLNKIPFIFVNCRDIDEDYICDSPFEDVAIKSRKIFNIASWCDETLAGSSFQVLLFPYETQTDVEQITTLFDPAQGGIADLPVIPFKSTAQRPGFDGPKLDHIDKYITMMNFYTEEILSKFGFKKDSKGSWESGVAKSIDFEKTESFLRTVSLQLQETEYKIIEFCALWENKDIEANIEYSFSYEKSDIEKEINRLLTAFTIPSKKLQTKAQKEITKLIFPNIENKELEEIALDLDSTTSDSLENNLEKTTL